MAASISLQRALACELSDPKVTIDTAGMDPQATELSNQLAAKIGGLSPESLAHLLHQLRVVAAKDGI